LVDDREIRDEPRTVRETTVINTGERSGSGGSLLLVVLLLIIVAVGAFLYFDDFFGRGAANVDVDVNIAAPKIDLPAVNLGAAAAPASNSAAK
jgi:hypothetical protein